MPTKTDDQRQVAHYVVQPQAYNAMVQTLGQLPYNQVAGVIQQLQIQTHAVFAEPPAGKVDRSSGANKNSSKPRARKA